MNAFNRVIVLVLSLSLSSSFLLNANETIEERNDNIPGLTVDSTTINENIIVRLSIEEEWEYMIFTADGNCIRMGILKRGKNKISLKGMCKGEYIVYLNNGEDRFIRKVMQ